jgi:hypothetical protein
MAGKGAYGNEHPKSDGTFETLQLLSVDCD